MAKNLTFVYQDKEFIAEPLKIERKKLYGYTLTKYFAADDSECQFATLTDDGMIIVPQGGTAQCILTEKGIAFSRSDLLAFDYQGNVLPKIPSSFDQKILLNDIATPEEYLSLNVHSIYQLNTNNPELLEVLKKNIFKISFNYREGYEPNDAFLVSNGKEIFMVVGSMADLEYIGLENIEPEILSLEDNDEDIEIDMDF